MYDKLNMLAGPSCFFLGVWFGDSSAEAASSMAEAVSSVISIRIGMQIHNMYRYIMDRCIHIYICA